MYKENVHIKRDIIKEIKKGDENMKTIYQLKTLIKNKLNEIKNNEKYQITAEIIFENRQLLENLDRISEELDVYSEKNNSSNELFKCKFDRSERIRVLDQITKLKNENKKLKNELFTPLELSCQRDKFVIANKKYLKY